MNKQQRNRLFVANALFALLVFSTTIFGPNVILVALVAIISSFIVEYLNSKLRKEEFDWTTALVTPLTITLLTTPVIIDQVWMVAVATIFGVFFAKAIFGGEGKNIFNPATVGLVFIALGFPSYVNLFVDPVSLVISTNTPASIFRANPEQLLASMDLWQMLTGNYAGAIGTTFKLGIIIYGVIAMVAKIADWRIPLTVLGTYFVLSVINNLFLGFEWNSFLYGFYSLLMGHLLFSTFFVATDEQTTPLYNKGKYIYGAMLGFITWIIQNIWLFNPTAPNLEGMIYSITLMNAVVGLIDVWTVPKIKDVPVLEEVTV